MTSGARMDMTGRTGAARLAMAEQATHSMTDARNAPRSSRRRRRPRWLWALPVVVVVVVGAWVGARMSRASEVEALELELRPMVQTVVASGRVLSPARIEVGTTLLGIVSGVEVEEGSRVAAGDLLVTLEDDELRASVAAAEAAVEQARLSVESVRRAGSPVAREGLEQARLEMELAEQRVERLERLLRSGAVTSTELDEARFRLDATRSRRRQAELTARDRSSAGSEYRLGLASLGQSRANLAAAESRLARSRVRAPADGTILRRAAEPGDVVQPGQVLLVLAREGRTRISVPIDERNIGGLALGQPARVAAEAFADQPFAAQVDFIAPAVDADRGTVEVRLGVDAPPAVLRADMTVTAEIEVARRQGVLAVPVGALVAGATGLPTVLVAEDGVAVARPVTTGARGSALVEVLDGLREGDVVLLPETGQVRAGAPVRPRLSRGLR